MMKILQLHNRYLQRGGEDVVADQEAELLADRGHQVVQWIRDNRDELAGPKGLARRLMLPFTTHYSRKSKREAERLLRGEKQSNGNSIQNLKVFGSNGFDSGAGPYDLMHLHNFFPLFTPSVFDAALQAGVPSVMTLHNYRLIHPGATLFHDGEIDKRSVNGSAWRCVTDGVYRGSMLQTAVVARMIEYHRRKGTWNRVPTRFIALTEFAKHKLVEGGLPEEKIVVKPNYVEDPGREWAERRMDKLKGESSKLKGGSPQSKAESSKLKGESGPESQKPYFLFVGRVSREKGVEDLVETWLRGGLQMELRVAGDGPERKRLKQKAEKNPQIRWLGRLGREQVLEEMAGAAALLFPSRWYEGFPMTLLEAFSVGCPAVVTDIGSQAEIVRDGETGLQVAVGEYGEMEEVVQRLAGDPELNLKLSRRARKEYEERFTPERNYERLMEIYEEILS